MHNKTGIRWLKVIIAGLLTEVCVVILIIIVVTAYKYTLSPTEDNFQAFANQAGYYIGIIGGALMAFLFALWVGRSLKADFLINGFLVACVAVILHVGLFVASRAEFQMAYVIADALKLVGGLAGGHLGQRKYFQPSVAGKHAT